MVDYTFYFLFFLSPLDGNEVVCNLELEDKDDNDVQCNKKEAEPKVGMKFSSEQEPKRLEGVVLVRWTMRVMIGWSPWLKSTNIEWVQRRAGTCCLVFITTSILPDG